MRLLFERLTLVAILLASASACRIAEPRGNSMGQDYLEREFKCTETPLPVEVDPGFGLIKQAVRANWGNENRKSARIVLTGDSTIALFAGPRLQAYLPGLDVANRGIGGDTSGGLLARLDSDVVALHPSTVVIVIGGNDILQGRCMRTVLTNTTNIFRTLKESLPGVRIIMVSIPPVVSWKANSITPYYNRKLEYLTRDEGIEYLDLWPALSDSDKPQLKEEFHFRLPGGKVDQVHFNDKGYETFGRLLQPLLSR